MRIEELKIIEIASVLAGPLCGSFFAELGARVIKVEHPENGDITRSWLLPEEKDSNKPGSYYASANYGKNVLRLDLKSEKDKNILFHELKDADILLSNFKKGDAEKFGLTRNVLRSQFPKLIQGNIVGFGADDDRLAFDMVLQAESGFLSMNGTAAGELCKMPVALIDVMAAHQLKEALLIALLEGNPKGAFIEVSLYETAIASLANQASAYLMQNKVAKPMGNLHPNIAPYGEIIRFQDGKRLVLAIGNNNHFKALTHILGLSELAKHPDFSTNQNRVIHRSELLEHLQSKAGQLPFEATYKSLIENKVPIGRIRSMDEVFMDKEAQNLILEDTQEKTVLKRAKTFIARMESL